MSNNLQTVNNYALCNNSKSKIKMEKQDARILSNTQS